MGAARPVQTLLSGVHPSGVKSAAAARWRLHLRRKPDVKRVLQRRSPGSNAPENLIPTRGVGGGDFGSQQMLQERICGRPPQLNAGIKGSWCSGRRGEQVRRSDPPGGPHQRPHQQPDTSAADLGGHQIKANGQFPATLALQHKCNWEIQRAFWNLQSPPSVSAFRNNQLQQ